MNLLRLLLPAFLATLSVSCAFAAPGSLAATVPSADGMIQLRATGTPGVPQILELTTDLTHWMPLEYASMGSGAAVWELPAGSAEFHAYRLREAVAGEIPNPLNLVATDNPDFLRTTLVSVDGGSQTFTDDNGINYRLEIPPGALLSSEEVTFSVIQSVAGWPLSGEFVAGIRLEPENLLLLQPATLTITLPEATSALRGLSWQRTGDSLQAQPLQVAGRQITLPVARFAAYAVAVAKTPDVATLQAHPPEGLVQQLEQSLALDLPGSGSPASLATRQPQGLPPREVTRIRQWFDTHLRNPLENAAQDDSLIDIVLNQVLAWEVAMHMLYSPSQINSLSDLFDEANQMAAKAIYLGLNRASRRCDSHDLQALGRIVHLGQLMERPPWSSAFTAADLKLFRQKVKNCATFDLELDAVVKDTDHAGSGESRVHDHWTLEFKDEALTRITGQGAVSLTASYQPSQPKCQVASVTPSPGIARIPEFNLAPVARAFYSRTQPATAAGISLLFTPLALPPEENIVLSCPPSTVPLEGFWSLGFGSAYKGTIVKSPLGQLFRVRGWAKGAPDIVGEKQETFVVNSGSARLDIDARWSIRHTPIPFH